MTDPIDVAAAAIHAATPGLSAHRPWPELTNPEQGRYRRAATAALEAAMPELLDQIEQLQAVVRDQHDDCTYQARIAAVEKWHQPLPYYDVPTKYYCKECGPNHSLYPCRTIKAARGE